MFHTLNLPHLFPRPLQEKLSEQLEGQRQEQALQRYHSEAEELDHWLLSTRATLSSALQPLNEDLDMEEQLIDCQVRITIPSSLKAALTGKINTDIEPVSFRFPMMAFLPELLLAALPTRAKFEIFSVQEKLFVTGNMHKLPMPKSLNRWTQM